MHACVYVCVCVCVCDICKTTNSSTIFVCLVTMCDYVNSPVWGFAAAFLSVIALAIVCNCIASFHLDILNWQEHMCAPGTVNMHYFVWIFVCAWYTFLLFIHSFVHLCFLLQLLSVLSQWAASVCWDTVHMNR